MTKWVLSKQFQVSSTLKNQPVHSPHEQIKWKNYMIISMPIHDRSPLKTKTMRKLPPLYKGHFQKRERKSEQN